MYNLFLKQHAVLYKYLGQDNLTGNRDMCGAIICI